MAIFMSADIINAGLLSDHSFGWLGFFADVVVKGMILLMVAGSMVIFFRRSAAAVRHLVWSLALASFLILPLVSVVLPKWRLGLISNAAASDSNVPAKSNKRAQAPAPLPTNQIAPLAIEDQQIAPSVENKVSNSYIEPTPLTANWSLRILMIWFAGMLIVLGRLLIGTIGIRRIVRSATPLTNGEWPILERTLSWRLGIANPIPLYKTDKLEMPLTSGAFKSAIVVPADADEWTNERRQVVLLHELAHVKRRDCLTQLVAHIACAIYWFNPLVWFAAKQLRIERERACDDYVLGVGTLASDYATHLLEIARTMGGAKCPSLAAVAIAKRSQLEGRLLAILDPNLRRKGLNSRSTALLVASLTLLIMPLAAISPFAKAATVDKFEHQSDRSRDTVVGQNFSQTSKTDTVLSTNTSTLTSTTQATVESGSSVSSPQTSTMVQSADINPQQNSGPAPTPMPMPMPTPMPMPMPAPAPMGGEFHDGHNHNHDREQASSESDGKVIDALLIALKDSNKEVRQQAIWALGQREDKRAVEGLIGALSDEEPSIRHQAAWALGQIEDRRATPALVKALKDNNPSVRHQAAWALGQLEDKSAVDGLIAALSDQSESVRSQAAWALGQLEDPRSVPGLVNALAKDESSGVRRQCIWALGQIGDKSAVEGLISALKDKSADTRGMAAWSLGQIGDSRATDALIAALKDENAHVRQQAAWALAQLNSH